MIPSSGRRKRKVPLKSNWSHFQIGLCRCYLEIPVWLHYIVSGSLYSQSARKLRSSLLGSSKHNRCYCQEGTSLMSQCPLFIWIQKWWSEMQPCPKKKSHPELRPLAVWWNKTDKLWQRVGWRSKNSEYIYLLLCLDEVYKLLCSTCRLFGMPFYRACVSQWAVCIELKNVTFGFEVLR